MLERANALSETSGEAGGGVPSTARVLLAAKSAGEMRSLARVLRARGYEVDEATSSRNVYRLLAAADFDLWIFDARMLCLASSAVWASLRYAHTEGRGRPASPVCPVLVLTRRGDTWAGDTLSAAARSIALMSWNPEAWRLGLLEVPCDDALLARTAEALLPAEAPLARG
ncbi:MAG: hypothetical protein L6R28_03255 [Planctomycetes bacterium]|nr:hypothetical protein [Planctomycetota bacterium]